MSVSIALICEGVTDPPTVCALADRVIIAGVDWIDADEIDTHRNYRGFLQTDSYLAWSGIDTLARQNRCRSLGHFEGLPLHGDGHKLLKAIRLLTLHSPTEQPIDAIIVFRDGDREYDARREAIVRVRDTYHLAIPVVIGIANRMRECWVLNGFEPADETEQARYTAEFERVGFDPRMRAHDLTDTNEHEDRSPKRVLNTLTGSDNERECQCMTRTSFDLLRARGEQTGLREFIDELESKLLTAFGC